MREILFRGKRDGDGEWVMGDRVCYSDYVMIWDLIDKRVGYLVDPATVGQYTGLCDKNGKKIFEGDILTTDLFRPYVVVIFRDGCFMFNCNDGGKDYWDIMLPIMKEAQTQTLYHEVIGNIHDNPELLKEGRSEIRVNATEEQEKWYLMTALKKGR